MENFYFLKTENLNIKKKLHTFKKQILLTVYIPIQQIEKYDKDI